MTVAEMQAYLAAHGVQEDDVYTIGGLGGGDIDGIEFIDGAWHTYFSERGSKNSYRRWETEEDAVAYILPLIVDLARNYGIWRN